VCEDASAGTTKNTHHFIRQLGDALNEEPHLFPQGLWVDGTLRPANSGATGCLPWINLQKIERPEQMLWLALLGVQAIFPEHQPYLHDDCDARLEETTEPAVLHSGRPDTPGRPVLDVPGVTKEHGLLRITIDLDTPPRKKPRAPTARYSIEKRGCYTNNPYAHRLKNKIDVVLHKGGVPSKDAQPQVSLLLGGKTLSV
jgi:hypothetical protein